MSNILAINAGSSSLKFQLLKMPEEQVICKGLIERIGMEDSIFSISYSTEKVKKQYNIPDHKKAVDLLLEHLTGLGIIKSLEDINGIGHRVVHGGELFND